MSGFFGCITNRDCVNDVFYGTDYHSHLGTKRAGMVFWSIDSGFQRAIHSLEDGYFRNKFEKDLKRFSGNSGNGHALGYSNQRKIPHVRPYSKYTPTWPPIGLPKEKLCTHCWDGTNYF